MKTTVKNRKLARISLPAALLLAALAPLAAQTSQGDRLLPERYLREYDPVTVVFSRDRGPAEGGPGDDASVLLSIQPRHPGEYRWLDARSLQFLPADPWPPLRSFSFKSPEGRWSLSTLMSPPGSLSPQAGSTNLGSFQELSMTMAVPMDPVRLAEMIFFEVRDLPGLDSQEAKRLTKRDFSIKELDRSSAKSQATYRLTLDRPVGDGKAVTMSIKLSLDGSAPGSVANYVFKTRPAFRVQSFGAGNVSFPVSSSGSNYPADQAVDRGASSQPLFIEFSESLEASPSVELLKKMIKVNPAPTNMRFEVSGRRLYAYFESETDKDYQFSLSHGELKSSSGRPLSPFGPSSFSFFHKSLSDYIAWDAGQAILERYGPRAFPMRGRGVDKVDLRIYQIDPESRNFWPFPESGVTVDEAARPPMPGEEPSYGTQLGQQIRLLGSPGFSDVVDLPTAGTSSAAYFGLDLEPALRRMGRAGVAGTYLVGYRALGSGTQRSYVRVQVTDLSLSAVEEENAIVFYVTSLSSAKPVSGARISLGCRAARQAGGPMEEIVLAEGRTDKDGRYRYAHGQAMKYRPDRITVKTDDDVLVLDPAAAPPYFHNDHWFGAQSTWLSWLASEPMREAEKPRYRAYLFTERPIYRAEEAVHIQGYLRVREKGLIKADDSKRERSLLVRGPGGAEWRYPLEIKGNGYVYQKFEEPDLPSGDYRADIVDTILGTSLASVSFKKEAYRVPSFEIDLSGPDYVPFDQPFEVLLTATYYSGGKVVGQPVEWDVAEYAYSVSPAAYPGYAFSSYARTGGSYGDEGLSASQREDVTDDTGAARISIDPRAAQSINARAYRIQASVRGADAQTVSNSKTVRALPPFSVGLKLPRFETEKQAVRASILVLDHLEKPLAGKKVLLKLYERQWHSYLTETDISTGQAKYVSDVVDQQVLEREFVSMAGPLDAVLPVANAGVYVVELQARDEAGRLQSVKGDLFVAGPSPVAWKRTQAAVFETILDKAVYAPGEVAKVLLQSPFQEGRALVVIERPEGNEYRWTDVANGQGIVQVEVRANQTPRFPVHALLMRGRLAQGGLQGGVDRSRPLSVASTTWIAVDPAPNRVTVDLSHDATSLPGGDFKVKISLSDGAGKPLSGEVALWLVDRAIFSLAPERFKSPLEAFIDPVNGSLRISDTRNLAVGNLPFDSIPGGDEAMRAAMEYSLFETTTVRKNFQTVPYYEPAIKVGPKGQAEVTIKLPDNLTEFAIRAVATSGYDRFGIARSTLAVRLPVLVQEALPRFVRPGDEMLAGGIARVVEGKGGKAVAEAKTEGLIFQPSGKDSDKREAVLPDKEALKLYFKMRAPSGLAGDKEQTVSFFLAAKRLQDGASDAFKLVLPVKQDNIIKRIETSLVPPKGKEINFPSTDGAARSGSIVQTLIVSANPDLVRVLSALRFQMAYEYGCAEQRISRIYPAVALQAALGEAGLPPEMLPRTPDVKALLSYLATCIDPNGLYAFYPGDQGRVFLTAYVAEFLSLLKRTGTAVDQKLIDAPLRSLKEALRSDYDHFSQGYSTMERVRAMIALDGLGYFDQGYAKQLLADAAGADLTTRAEAYRVLKDKKGLPAGDLKKLKASLADSLVFKKDKGVLVYAGMQGQRSWSGNPFLYSAPVEAAAVYAALSPEDPKSAETRALLAGILAMAGDDGWGDTYSNSRVLLSLVEAMTESKAMRPAKVEYNDGKDWKALDTKDRLFGYLRLKTDKVLKVRIQSQNDKQPTAVTMAVEFAPSKPGSELKAENAGFALERDLVSYGDGKTRGKLSQVKMGATISFKEGDVVEDHVRVVNPVDRDFVAVRVPLPSGFEPMNPALATSPAEARPAGTISLAPAYADYEDDQVTFYYNRLPRGSYDFYFRARANFQGSYVLPPASARALYDSKVYGYSDGSKVFVIEAE